MIRKNGGKASGEESVSFAAGYARGKKRLSDRIEKHRTQTIPSRKPGGERIREQGSTTSLRSAAPLERLDVSLGRGRFEDVTRSWRESASSEEGGRPSCDDGRHTSGGPVCRERRKGSQQQRISKKNRCWARRQQKKDPPQSRVKKKGWKNAWAEKVFL